MDSNVPDEILLRIFRELDVSALLACLAVSQRWRRVASDDRIWEELFLGSLSVHKRVHVDYSQHHVDLQLERASQWMRLYDANHGRPPRMHCRTLEGLSTRGAAENRVTSRDERVADFRRLLLQPFAITFRDAYFERKRRRQARSRLKIKLTCAPRFFVLMIDIAGNYFPYMGSYVEQPDIVVHVKEEALMTLTTADRQERLELIMQRCTTATTPVRQLNAVSRAALDRAVDVLLMKRALARLPAPQLVWGDLFPPRPNAHRLHKDNIANLFSNPALFPVLLWRNIFQDSLSVTAGAEDMPMHLNFTPNLFCVSGEHRDLGGQWTLGFHLDGTIASLTFECHREYSLDGRTRLLAYFHDNVELLKAKCDGGGLVLMNEHTYSIGNDHCNEATFSADPASFASVCGADVPRPRIRVFYLEQLRRLVLQYVGDRGTGLRVMMWYIFNAEKWDADRMMYSSATTSTF